VKSTPDRGAEHPRLVDAKAAAALLGVPESWVRAETRAERIPYVALGRYRRYEPQSLEEWWRTRARGPRRDRGAAAAEAKRAREAA
jgi:excisionase family DNA binding protein